MGRAADPDPWRDRNGAAGPGEDLNGIAGELLVTLYCTEINVFIALNLALRHCSDAPSRGRRAMTMITNTVAARWTAQPAKANAKTNAMSDLSQPRPPLLWLQRLFWRSELKTLDAAQMRDCGLDPEAVAREAAKP